MKLFIAEKPSQAKDIAQVLGAIEKGNGYIECKDDVIVTWGFGHLLELANPEEYGIQFRLWDLANLPIVPKTWVMKPKDSSSKQLSLILKLLKQTKHVIIATDADREGELIAREILEYASWKGKVERLWLSALDAASIKKALGALRSDDQTVKLFYAGKARSYADWLVGMNMTRAISLLAQKAGHDGVFPVGRVQTPTLQLILDRDEAIANFVPVAYWDLMIKLEHQGIGFQAKWIAKDKVDEEGRCTDKAHAKAIADALKSNSVKVTSFECQRKKQSAPLPYSLSGLQLAAGQAYGLSATEVLEIAQSLYETHKAATYPRTDCNYLPESMFSEAKDVLAAIATVDPSIADTVKGANPSLKSRVWNDTKVTAHHAIIPTANTDFRVGSLSDKELKVYELVRMRYLAQFYPEMEYDQTIIMLESVERVKEEFKASGRVVVKAGWQSIVKEDEEDEAEQSLPKVAEGSQLPVKDSELQEKKTKPPQAYTEGTLIQAMKNVGRQVDDAELSKVLKETQGIGTEATRANIIEGLFKRKLLERNGKKKTLSVTDKGRVLLSALPVAIKSPAITARWESGLEQIAAGTTSFDFFMESQAKWLTELLQNAKSGKFTIVPVMGAVLCPQCNSPMRKRNSAKGEFWGCTGYPNCKGTRPCEEAKPEAKVETKPKRASRSKTQKK